MLDYYSCLTSSELSVHPAQHHKIDIIDRVNTIIANANGRNDFHVKDIK